MTKELLEKLSKPFGEEALESYQKPWHDKPFKYIAIHKVIQRWNDTVADEGFFNFEILTRPQDAIIGDEVVLAGRLAFTPMTKNADGSFNVGPTQFVDNIGSTKIDRAIEPKKDKNGNVVIKAGEPLSIGDDMKKAAADLFKKLSTFFSIGLYLYDEKSGKTAEMPATIPMSNGTGPTKPIASQTPTVNVPAWSIPQVNAPVPAPAPVAASTDAPFRLALSGQIAAIENLMKANQKTPEFLKTHGVTDLNKISYDKARSMIHILQGKKEPVKA